MRERDCARERPIDSARERPDDVPEATVSAVLWLSERV
jgi:hypothetical protein